MAARAVLVSPVRAPSAPRVALVAVVAFTGLVPACFVADIGDAAITCAGAPDCPEPLFCDGGLCRRATAGDTTPPGVVGGSARLTAGAIRPGSGTTLSFVATEPLAETPRLIADGLSFGDVTDDEGTFSVDVTAGAGADDGSHAINAVLVDVAGNSSEPVFLASVIVDGTPPSLTSSETPVTVPPGQPLVVGGTASEALAAATCTFAPVFAGDDVLVTGLIDGQDFSCDGPPFSVADTAIQVSAALTDLAGNRADVDLGNVSVFSTP